jgi:hypothetical protein
MNQRTQTAQMQSNFGLSLESTRKTSLPMLGGLSLLYTLFWSGAVQAGTFTDAPGALQGDIAINHKFQMSTDSIFQEDQLVGERRYNQNTSKLVMKIGLVDFMSADLSLPFGGETLSFSGGYEMKYDPLSQTGSYLDTPNIEDFSRSGKGLQGAELALNFYPFHTKIYSNRGDAGNWQMGLVYRAKDKSNFFTVDQAGSRGSGIGSSGIGIQTAFSNKNNNVEPYLVMKAIRSSAFESEIRGDDGTLFANSETISPAHTVDIRGGTELYLKDDVALASYITLDLFGEYRY